MSSSNLKDIFTVNRGDTDPDLELAISDENDDLIDLTGASSITLSMRHENGTTWHQFSGLQVLDPPNEKGSNLKYAWQAGDTDIDRGRYSCRVTVVSAGETQSFPTGSYFEIRIA